MGATGYSASTRISHQEFPKINLRRIALVLPIDDGRRDTVAIAEMKDAASRRTPAQRPPGKVVTFNSAKPDPAAEARISASDCSA